MGAQQGRGRIKDQSWIERHGDMKEQGDGGSIAGFDGRGKMESGMAAWQGMDGAERSEEHVVMVRSRA